MGNVVVCVELSDVLEFNKKRDRFEVSQTGYLDLNKAFQNNSVPPDFAQDDASFNGIEDPSKVIGRPKDSFDIMHYNKSVHDYKPSSPNPDGD